MPNETAALDKIRAAMAELEAARNELSAQLIKHKADPKGKDADYRRLLDLHGRVTHAMELLPHGGQR